MLLFLFYSCSETGNNNIIVCKLNKLKELNATCKTLEVKANPYSESNDSRKITIAYTIVPAKKSDNKKEPIIFLVGGPGASGIFNMEEMMKANVYSILREDRDLITLDYRGTGFSLPYPECDGNSTVEVINQCVKDLNSTIKLSDYTSKNIAYDIDKLLTQENIQKANLLGVSYGTRVAVTVARDFPDRVNRLILDGFFPIEANGLSQAKEAILDKLNTIKIKYNSSKADCRF